MHKPVHTSEVGAGKGAILLLLIFLLAVIGLAWKVTSRAAPLIQLKAPIKGLRQNTPLDFAVRDPHHHLKRISVEVRQGGHAFVVLDRAIPTPAWWRVWSRAGLREVTLTARVSRQEIPELQEGRATLVIAATNDSWGRYFRGGRSEFSLDLPVRLVPPSVEVLTSQHYINQGGCDVVLFKVSPEPPSRACRWGITSSPVGP